MQFSAEFVDRIRNQNQDVILVEFRAPTQQPLTLTIETGTGVFVITLPLKIIQAAIAVDANRDGTIKLASEDSSDVTSSTSPYRFWLNDDIDKLHTFEDSTADSMATVSETEEDDIGPPEASQFSWQADYVPSQAALSAHTYDAALSTATGSPNALQWTYNHPSSVIPEANFGPQTPNIYSGWHGSVLSGGGGGSKAVGQIKNFYNRNDWALSAPVWQFNQLTKPDWPDPNNDQPWIYGYVSGLGAPPNTYSSFARGDHFDDLGDLVPAKILDQGAPADVKDRYEIMAFAAEPQVKALGATDNVTQGITRGVDLQAIWGPDPRGQDHRTHSWHSGQFRNYIQYQRTYWEALLDQTGFNLPFTRLQ